MRTDWNRKSGNSAVFGSVFIRLKMIELRFRLYEWPKMYRWKRENMDFNCNDTHICTVENIKKKISSVFNRPPDLTDLAGLADLHR